MTGSKHSDSDKKYTATKQLQRKIRLSKLEAENLLTDIIRQLAKESRTIHKHGR